MKSFFGAFFSILFGALVIGIVVWVMSISIFLLTPYITELGAVISVVVLFIAIFAGFISFIVDPK